MKIMTAYWLGPLGSLNSCFFIFDCKLKEGILWLLHDSTTFFQAKKKYKKVWLAEKVAEANRGIIKIQQRTSRKMSIPPIFWSILFEFLKTLYDSLGIL